MIGWYVHHHGHGHLHRAGRVALELAARGERVTGISSLPCPRGWPGAWLQLARDDEGGPPHDPTAHGRLHWVPRGDAGLARRHAQLAAWIDREAPSVVVVDTSVEVALLARLHGIPVVTVLPPGERDDHAHRLALEVADAVVGAWPAGWTASLLPTTPRHVRDGVHAVGAVARYSAAAGIPATRRPGPPRAVLLAGTGDAGPSPSQLRAAQEDSPGWEWRPLGRGLPGGWADDPWPVLRDADVVVTHAGQNSLAEVAAARRPAVVLPRDRPFAEQRTTAAALVRDGGLPVLVRERWPERGWQQLLDDAACLPGAEWHRWNDDAGAERLANVVQQVARGSAACRATPAPATTTRAVR